MIRGCPNCIAMTIPVSSILFANCYCMKCGALVGVHWIAYLGFNVVIFTVTLITTTMVLMQMDLYAAILWFPFPVGSLSYVKARFSPLETKVEESEA